MPFERNTVRHFLNRIRRIPVEWDLREYRESLIRIESLNLENLADTEITRRAVRLREAARGGAGPPDIEEGAALFREAARRTLGLRPFDVQLFAGLALHRGRLVEMATGEGKTLAAVLPAFLAGIEGKGVHVLTFNDYLARRDSDWMEPVYRMLGLTVGVIQPNLAANCRRAAYRADVTYATAKEAGFDYLRDQLCLSAAGRVHREFFSAIVDEADSILIDEARVPLVIAGSTGSTEAAPGRLAGLARSMVEGRDFETDDGKRNIGLTEPGTLRLERLLGCGNLHAPENLDLLTRINLALHAEFLLRRDMDYIVRNGRVEIVDEFTGRVVADRHWPDGLQAAVEAKEGLRRGSGGEILGQMTIQHFLGLYPRLAGMTATARPAAEEIEDFYGLKTTVIPSHRPCIRRDEPDRVFDDRESKIRALVAEIKQAHAARRPVLVGTGGVRESEELAEDLRLAGVACEVLNAKNDELEAKIVAGAGVPGAVTISTNMAGRGTDIRLGGPDEALREEVAARGGLYVIGTNRHESRRIDRQLRGRAGRQGDPGTSRFFVSLEDPLFVRNGLAGELRRGRRTPGHGEVVDNSRLLREIEWGQSLVEAQNYEIRRMLWRYSRVSEFHRVLVQDRRREILTDDGAESLLAWADPERYRAAAARIGADRLEEIERRVTIYHIDRAWSEHLAWLRDTRDSIHLVAAGGRSPLHEFQRAAAEAFGELEKTVEAGILQTFASLPIDGGEVDLEAAGLNGPSSTWTYLVNDRAFEEIARPQNIGFHAVAIAWWGPIWLIPKIIRRWRSRREKSRTGEIPGPPGGTAVPPS